MHPQLGDFVSRNFYEQFDRTERFESGLPGSMFDHNLPGSGNKPAMWLNVPVSAGPHRRYGTSWVRQAEAHVITSQLRDWIDSPDGKKLTYGVISFYKAQADLIRHQLRRQLGKIVDGEQIRVGTVNSFQGMEFDVVFLSIVRTIPQGWRPRGRDRTKQAQQLFGHLCLYNRLNVSMRQKKLLVVVGDPALVTGDLAAEYIPGLVDFHQLARGSQSATHARTQSRAPAPLKAEPEAEAAGAEPEAGKEPGPIPGEEPLINFYTFVALARIGDPTYHSTMLRMLGRDPADRYQTYQEWCQEVLR